jgi:CheY-like chemotaxis protein
MSEPLLRNYRILVVEDEFLLADELQAELEDAGATVIGPVGALDRAIALIKAEPQIDGASLDASLGGEMVFPAADLLMQRGVAIVFTTGYDASIIPSRFSAVPRCEKPVDLRKVIQAIGQALQA